MFIILRGIEFCWGESRWFILFSPFKIELISPTFDLDWWNPTLSSVPWSRVWGRHGGDYFLNNQPPVTFWTSTICTRNYCLHSCIEQSILKANWCYCLHWSVWSWNTNMRLKLTWCGCQSGFSVHTMDSFLVSGMGFSVASPVPPCACITYTYWLFTCWIAGIEKLPWNNSKVDVYFWVVHIHPPHCCLRIAVVRPQLVHSWGCVAWPSN